MHILNLAKSTRTQLNHFNRLVKIVSRFHSLIIGYRNSLIQDSCKLLIGTILKGPTLLMSNTLVRPLSFFLSTQSQSTLVICCYFHSYWKVNHFFGFTSTFKIYILLFLLLVIIRVVDTLHKSFAVINLISQCRL